MEFNGIAHVFLTVSDLTRSRAFYQRLLPALGMTVVLDDEHSFYAVGAGTGIGLRPGGATAFDQQHTGLHHLCLRAKNRQSIDQLYQLLLAMQASIIHPPQEDGWAPGYYSVLFEDPDGIRLEANFVPGKGLLA